MIILKERGNWNEGYDVINEDENFTAVISTYEYLSDDFNYECLFSDICLHAGASMLKANEKIRFRCPRNCQHKRCSNAKYTGECDVVVFPVDDSPCYALPASALRNAKNLAPGIILQDEDDKTQKKEETKTDDKAQANVEAKGGEA